MMVGPSDGIDAALNVLSSMEQQNQGAVWFTKCNVKGNGNGLHLITGGNKFE
jgi:hypothetical protein